MQNPANNKRVHVCKCMYMRVWRNMKKREQERLSVGDGMSHGKACTANCSPSSDSTMGFLFWVVDKSIKYIQYRKCKI